MAPGGDYGPVEPVFRGSRAKKKSPPGGNNFIYGPGGDYGPVEPVFRGSRAKKKSPRGENILEPVYPKKMWVDPKKG